MFASGFAFYGEHEPRHPAFTGSGQAYLMRSLLILTLIMGSAVANDANLLLDDFSDSNVSAYGTSWQGFTDRVMGGRSDLSAGIVETDRGAAMRMTGTVRLDNNGGFIQVRLPLMRDGRAMNAIDFEAVRLEARGKPGPYFIHARTADTRRPWQYYRAPVMVAPDWTTVTVPLDDFEAVDIRRPFDRTTLMSIALVAYGEPFEAELEVASIEFLGRDD